MPELPDLQVFSRNLDEKLAGKKLEKLHAIYAKKMTPGEQALQRSIEGATLEKIFRDGKELHFAFDNGNVLALHMMLKGELHVFQGAHDRKYAIVELLFQGGAGLVMTDLQKQARTTLNPSPPEAPDALSDDVNFKFFSDRLGRSRAAVKKFLIDQNILRGIGNAYADEILWHARISPFSITSKIPEAAVRQLAKSVRAVLLAAEQKILKNYPGITAGEVRDFMAVHSADKTHSPTGAEIRIIKNARSTYYTDEQILYS
jgi:formamidopyrimidine-DNA glycosylase